MSSPRHLPRRRARITPRALVLVVVIGGLLFALIAPIRQYMEHTGHLDRLEEGVAELEAENEAFRAEIERLQDPDYIEYLARKCLGMVKKGEVAFVLVPEDGEPQPPDC